MRKLRGYSQTFHPLLLVAVIRGGCRGGGGGSSSRLSRTRRFINVVTSCRRYCRGVSVTTEADVAFLIKRSRRQGSLHCVSGSWEEMLVKGSC